MVGGLGLALVLTVFVFGGAIEPVISGVALLTFAFGWTMLGWLSSRRTDQPQRWAYVPAIFMGALGLAFLIFRPSDGAFRAFGWVWPIAAAALALWMIIQSRRHLHHQFSGHMHGHQRQPQPQEPAFGDLRGQRRNARRLHLYAVRQRGDLDRRPASTVSRGSGRPTGWSRRSGWKPWFPIHRRWRE